MHDQVIEVGTVFENADVRIIFTVVKIDVKFVSTRNAFCTRLHVRNHEFNHCLAILYLDEVLELVESGVHRILTKPLIGIITA